MTVHEELVRAGAVFAPGSDVPAHFGDPVGEQLAYEAGKGVHFAGAVGVVAVAGPDRLSWLTTLSSQVVTDLGESSKELLLLDPNGRIQFAVGIVDRAADETAFLFTEPEYAADLAAFLESRRFMLRVEVFDRSADYLAFTAVNSQAQIPDGALVWRDPWPGVEEGGARYFTGNHPGQAHRISVYAVPMTGAADVIAAHSTRLVGTLAAEATRIAAWRPRQSSEVDDKAMPAELDWLRTAVHLDKGCYCGQESVARIVNLGKPPRRLTFLQLDGSLGSLPEPGQPVMLGDRQVGVVTSTARHAEMGPIALAMLRRGLDPAAALTVGDIAAAQELIVPIEGRSDHSPAERPGAGLKRLDSGGRDIRTTGPGTAR